MPVRARMEVPPLTGFATRPGKMYLLLFVQRSAYIAGGASETGRRGVGRGGAGGGGRGGREGGRGNRGGRSRLRLKKKLPGDGHDDAEYKFQRRSHLRPRFVPRLASPSNPLYSFLGFRSPRSGRTVNEPRDGQSDARRVRDPREEKRTLLSGDEAVKMNSEEEGGKAVRVVSF